MSRHNNASPAERLRAVKSAIRNPYVWPGGYPLYVIMDDGGALSIDSARENWRELVWSTLRGMRDDWRVAAVDVNWEDSELTCDHSGKRIESAYGEQEEESGNE